MQGEPKLRYHASKHTQAGMMEGLLLLLRAMHASGAERLLTLHNTYTAWSRPDAPQHLLHGPEQTIDSDSEKHRDKYEFANRLGPEEPLKDSEKHADGHDVIEGVLPQELVAPEPCGTAGGASSSTVVDAPSISGRSAAEAPGQSDFEEWLKGVERRGAGPHFLAQTSAHQVLCLAILLLGAAKKMQDSGCALYRTAR
jgi:hypothetical protein